MALDDAAVSASGMDVLIDDPTGNAVATVVHDPANPSVNVALANGSTLTIPGRVITQPNGADLHVLEVRSLTIRPGSRLKILGTKPVAIVSHFDVYIGGTLDYSGTGNFAQFLHPGCDIANATPPAMGGAGNATSGGAASNATPGGAALPSNPMLIPLEGGCHSLLGIGGGGLQIVSRRRIAVAATGVIDVAGRRGSALTSGGGFVMTGGGAGGNVVLEAPGVGLATGSVVIGRGGSGAAGNTNTRMVADGLPGDHDLTAATVPGGRCPDCTAVGGTGGTESSASGAGTGTAPGVAGGGGAVGRCVVRSKAFTPAPTGTMKLTATTDTIRTR